MLHPSPLPKYRGGTPLQNQIINDDLDSAVTIFKMTSVMDAGPICSQEYLSLRGDLSVIFSRIVSIGTRMTLDIINNGISFVEQDHNSATVFQRRKPFEAKIHVGHRFFFRSCTTKFACQDPYLMPLLGPLMVKNCL